MQKLTYRALKHVALITLSASVAALPASAEQPKTVAISGASAPLKMQPDIQPWQAGPFESDHRDLLIAANAVEADDDEDIIVLMHETKLSIDDDGHMTRTRRLVYRIATQDGADNWSSVSRSWSPWHQTKPVIRARVVSRNGKLHELDPETLTSSPTRSGDSDIYSDHLRLQAPLPGIGPGAVVEEMHSVTEHDSFFTNADFGRHVFAYGYPTINSRLIVEAPSNRLPKWKQAGLDSEPTITEADGRTTMVWSAGPFGDYEQFAGMPRDYIRNAYVAVSTGSDWATLAQRYHKNVEEQLKDTVIEPFLPVVTDKLGRRKIIEQLVEHLHKEIRYTGLEFSEASVIPWTPAKVISRGYGDCKDKATLLTAMLRKYGIEANVALLRVGGRYDVDAELPSFGMFDHAIVYLPEDDLWIDATAASTPVGSLPRSVQNRSALVASETTTALKKTPIAQATDNISVETRVIKLQEFGNAAVQEQTLATGAIEASYRDYYGSESDSGIKESFESYADNEYDGQLGKYSLSDSKQLSVPFLIDIEITDAAVAEASMEGANITISRDTILLRMPEALQYEPEPIDKDDPEQEPEKERTVDYVFGMPFHNEWHYEIHAPDSFELVNSLVSEKQKLGTINFEQKVSKTDYGLKVSFYLNSGERRITAEQFRATRAAVSRFDEQEDFLLSFEHRAQAALERGEIGPAISMLKEARDAAPESGLAHARIGLAMLAAGLGQAARDELALAVQLEPESSHLYQLQGEVFEHDLLGRRLVPGWNREAAIKAYRRSIELDPNNMISALSLAIIYEHNERGFRYEDKNGLSEAIALYQEHYDYVRDYMPGLRNNLAFGLFYTGRFDELRVHLDKEEPGVSDLMKLSMLVEEQGEAGMLAARRYTGTGSNRSERLNTAASLFLNKRNYQAAAIVLKEAAKGSDDAANFLGRAAIVEQTAPFNGASLDKTNPEQTMLRLAAAMAGQSSEKPADLLPPQITEWMEKSDFDEIETGRVVLEQAAREVDLSLQTLMDVSKVVYQSAVIDQHDDFLFRVIGSDPSSASGTSINYVIKADDSDTMMLLLGNASASTVGIEVLRQLEKGNIDAAIALLDWERDNYEQLPEDAVSLPFVAIWGNDIPKTPDQIKLAALEHIGNSPDRLIEHKLAILKTIKPENLQDARWLEVGRVAPQMALGNWQAVLESCEKLLAEFPDSDSLLGAKMMAMGHLGKTAELNALANASIAGGKDEINILRTMLNALAEADDFPAALSVAEKVLESGNAHAGDFNNAAWFTQYVAGEEEQGLTWARKALKMAPGESDLLLNTLAATLAEFEEGNAAKQVVWQSMEAAGRSLPNENDWYVLGRVAEGFGLHKEALVAYEKVLAINPDKATSSSAELARRRIKGLMAKPTADNSESTLKTMPENAAEEISKASTKPRLEPEVM